MDDPLDQEGCSFAGLKEGPSLACLKCIQQDVQLRKAKLVGVGNQSRLLYVIYVILMGEGSGVDLGGCSAHVLLLHRWKVLYCTRDRAASSAGKVRW